MSWSGNGAGATHSNSYRGTIPAQMLGSRPPGAVYDSACLESTFFYLVSGESGCAESPLGIASSGEPIPNGAPCPTPP